MAWLLAKFKWSPARSESTYWKDFGLAEGQLPKYLTFSKSAYSSAEPNN
jgi:hypothetical protein